MRHFVVGVDASNLRAGGGLVHITRLLASARPEKHGIGRVLVWGGKQVLDRIREAEWLEKIPVRALDRSTPFRVHWQRFVLPRQLRPMGCDVLFAPGGTTSPHCMIPSVVMPQNLLVFERDEAARFSRFSYPRLRYSLLRWGQEDSIRRAAGVICLTHYALQVIRDEIGSFSGRWSIIPHGLDARFFRDPRPPRPPQSVSPEDPYRIVYVSIVNLYKHPWNVASAVSRLRQGGCPVSVRFVGPAYRPALGRLTRVMERLDPGGRFLHYDGPLPFDRIHEAYRTADAFVFASSCEHLPIILLEAMAAGLPIACSDRGPMPEVLGDAGIYFDPESPEDIRQAIAKLLEDPDLRRELAAAAHQRAKSFSWRVCADATLGFLRECAEGGRGRRKNVY